MALPTSPQFLRLYNPNKPSSAPPPMLAHGPKPKAMDKAFCPRATYPWGGMKQQACLFCTSSMSRARGHGFNEKCQGCFFNPRLPGPLDCWQQRKRSGFYKILRNAGAAIRKLKKKQLWPNEKKIGIKMSEHIGLVSDEKKLMYN